MMKTIFAMAVTAFFMTKMVIFIAVIAFLMSLGPSSCNDLLKVMKAGIMEIPDAFVLNKCDEGRAAHAAYAVIIAPSNATAGA